MEKKLKFFIIYGFFFLSPISAPFIPEFNSPLGKINVDMMWLFLMSILGIYYIIVSQKKIFISSSVKILVIYYFYTFLNAILKGYFNFIIKTEIALIISSIVIFIIFDNLDYLPEDKEKLLRILGILSIFLFIGALFQQYYDMYIFYPEERVYDLRTIDFEGYWRRTSLFDAMIQNQGGIGLIMLTLILTLSISHKYNKKNVLYILFMLYVSYYSFSRYIYISILLIFALFLYYKFQTGKSGKFFVPVFIFVLLFLILSYAEYFVRTDLFQTRITADVSGRTTDPTDFLTQYIDRHPVISGLGFSSYSIEYYYGSIRRLHSGIWDLFFKDGLIGIFLFIILLFTFYKKALMIYRITKNPMYFLFPVLIFMINITANLNIFFFWGYLLGYFMMSIDYQIAIKGIHKDLLGNNSK